MITDIMQVIIPAAGRGSRFVEQGFTTPKPLIEVMGKPIIKWSTDGLRGVEDAHFIFLVLEEHIVEHHIDNRLRDLYPGCQVVPVPGVTEGAACTVLLARDYLDMHDDLVIANCDNLFLIDIEKAKYDAGDGAGIIFYIAGRNPHWSYVEIDGQGKTIRVVEKQLISDRATVGCYYFRKAHYFIEAADRMIARNTRTNGEFYVSPVYNILIEQGKVIQTFPCDLHYSLGTPEELETFRTIFDPAYKKAHAVVGV